MPAFGYVDIQGIVDFRTVVTVVERCAGERQQAVEPRYERSVELYCRNIGGNVGHQRVEKLCLYCENLILRAKNLLLVFLKFLCDIALSVYKRLLPYPLLRNFFLMRIAHLDIVAEHVIIGYFQARYAGCLAFALLYVKQIVLSGIGNLAQVVQLLTDTLTYDVAAVCHIRSVRIKLALYTVADCGASVELLTHRAQHRIGGRFTIILYRGYCPQGIFQLHGFSRGYAPHGNFRHKTLDVAYGFHLPL